MTHVVLAANDAYAAWEAEGAELAKRRASLVGQIMAGTAEQEKVDAAHEQKVREAVEKSQAIPPKPEPVDRSHLDAALWMQQWAEDTHRERRTAVIAEAADTGAFVGLEDREMARRARLVALAPEIEECLREAREDATLLRSLVLAIDLKNGRTTHPSRAERIDTKPDLETMLAAATQGRSLLVPEEPQPRPPRVMVDDDSDTAHRLGHRQAMEANQARLGYSQGGAFGGHDDRPRIANQGRRPGEI